MRLSLRAFAAPAVLLLIALTPRARADDGLQERFRPIPVAIEGGPAAAGPGLYVGVQEHGFDKTPDELAKDTPADSVEHALAEYLHAIATNDIQKYRAATDAGNGAPAELAEDRSEMPKGSKVRVVRRFAVGGATLFVVDPHTARGGDQPLITLLFVSKGGRQVCSTKGLDHPIVQVFMALARALDADPKAFAAADAPAACPNSITFDTLFGDDGRHPVTFRFNGYRLAYPIGSPRQLPPGGRDLVGLPRDYADAVRFYADAVAKLASDDVDGYSASLGGATSKRFFQDKIGRARQSVVDDAARPRYIGYVLGSPQLKVLFETPKGGVNPDFELTYQQVATPPAGKPSIVNVHQLALLNDLFTWPDFKKALITQYIDPPAKK